MTEEQLKQLKERLELRIKITEENAERWATKGETFTFMKEYNATHAEAYKIVLEDIEKIINE